MAITRLSAIENQHLESVFAQALQIDELSKGAGLHEKRQITVRIT